MGRHEALTSAASAVQARGSASLAKPVTDDLACLRVAIVNVFFVGTRGAGDRGWVLIDAGLPGTAGRIRRAAAERFGDGARPAAIVLTHAHFDHAGALEELAEGWDAPVYAHTLEHPYVTGMASYPPPDPTVGGGAMARLSPLYPRGPWDVSRRLRTLPVDHTVPGMPGWRWIHTPGHAPGHVSLFRDRDRVLVAGDAVVTTKQESMLAALSQRPELHGPPMYFTHDWDRARHSVEVLAELEPEILATGHGRPLAGAAVADGLRVLARDFDALARPDHGRYVYEPARFDVGGVVSVPPEVEDPFPRTVAVIGAGLLAGIVIATLRRRNREKDGRPLQHDREVALAGSAFEELQHVPSARADGVDARSLPPATSSTGRPFDFGTDASAPGDVPGGP